MARFTSADRARRLLALFGKLTPGEIPLAALADELGTTEADLSADLETLSLCGVAPYSPDQLVDVFVEDGVVQVYSPPPALREPVRLSAAEAEALAAALSAAGFSADDPLTARLLAAASMRFDAAEMERTLQAASEPHDAGVFEALAEGARDARVVEIRYQKEGAEGAEARRVEPLQLFAERGSWYLSAWCRSAGAVRTFRIDRVLLVEASEERAIHATVAKVGTTAKRPKTRDGGGPAAFSPAGLPLARLRFAPGEAFIEREWPGGRVLSTSNEAGTIAEVPYAGTAWIARRVVARLGAVEVLEPAELRSAVRELAREEIGRDAG
ncbi:MAG: helix-turn-helix transcriptional regulator [Coriobacteriia bacterium]